MWNRAAVLGQAFLRPGMDKPRSARTGTRGPWREEDQLAPNDIYTFGRRCSVGD